eukprot:COSAG05_NODE_153_length_15894_cov_27.910415_19_plen_68_part_00
MLSIDWLERTHPSLMGSKHGLTGHLYLAPVWSSNRGDDEEEGDEAGSGDGGSEMMLYYASHGRPHRP